MPSHVCNAIIQNRFKFCNTLISLFGIMLVKFLPFFLCSLLIYGALHFWDPKFFLKIYTFRVITANFCYFWNLQLIFKIQYSRIVFRFFGIGCTMSVTISAEKCVACGACVVICPNRAIQLRGGAARVDSARCTACLRCVCKCYTRAILPPDTARGSGGKER